MLSPKRIAVIEGLRQAFASTRLEDGIGLWEAQGIDDHEDQSVCEKYRHTDEKENWQNIPPEVLARCHSSLSFFNPKGMRFHLPAFLMAELNGTLSMGTEFHLVSLSDYSIRQMSLLTPEQKRAIAACLWEMLDDSRFELEHEEIARALENYWEK